MTQAEAAMLVEQLALLKMFPADPGARYALRMLLVRMCPSFEAGQWLVDRALDRFDEWPGPRELRGLLSSRFPPSDGVNAYSKKLGEDSLVSPNSKQIAGPETKALPPRQIASADRTTGAAMRVLCQTSRLKDLDLLAPATPEEIRTAPEWLLRQEGYNDSPAAPPPVQSEPIREQDRVQRIIREARAVLADPQRSSSECEIARQILRDFGVEEGHD
jgi:hypothetical protein